MSAIAVAGIAGTAFSVYSGVQAGKSARNALSAEQAQLAKNQGIANELKDRQQTLVDKPLTALEAQDQSLNLTPEAQMAQDRFKAEMGTADRQVQEQADTAGAGVTGGRMLTNQFRKAEGIAGIHLQDTAAKRANLRGDLQLAQQTPGWAGVATGANTQMAGFEGQQAATAQQQQQSAYGAVAAGLGGLAKMYAGYDAPEPQNDPVTTATNAPNLGPNLPDRTTANVDGLFPGGVDPSLWQSNQNRTLPSGWNVYPGQVGGR